MKIGILQYDISWEDRKKNRQRISEILKGAPELDWIILPEMSLSGFSMDSQKTTIDEDDLLFIKNTAIAQKAFLTTGAVRESKNCLITVDPEGSELPVYAKMHLFSFARENHHYQNGTEPVSLQIKGWRITPAICYDLRFANLFWESAPRTDLYIVIANWPASRREHWITLLRARAIENQSFVVGVNRIGKDPNNEHCGDSLVINPFGEILLHSDNREGLFTAQISLDQVEEVREKFQFIPDRRDIKASLS